jgi:hypothetical protein
MQRIVIPMAIGRPPESHPSRAGSFPERPDVRPPLALLCVVLLLGVWLPSPGAARHRAAAVMEGSDMTTSWLAIRNAHAFPLPEVPVGPISTSGISSSGKSRRGNALSRCSTFRRRRSKLGAVLADDESRSLGATFGVVDGDRYPS